MSLLIIEVQGAQGRNLAFTKSVIYYITGITKSDTATQGLHSTKRKFIQCEKTV